MNRKCSLEVRFGRRSRGPQVSRLRCFAVAVIVLAAMTSAVDSAQAAKGPSDAAVIRGGFSAAGGRSAAGPYAAMLIYDLPDVSAPPDARESLQVFAALDASRCLLLATRVGS